MTLPYHVKNFSIDKDGNLKYDVANFDFSNYVSNGLKTLPLYSNERHNFKFKCIYQIVIDLIASKIMDKAWFNAFDIYVKKLEKDPYISLGDYEVQNFTLLIDKILKKVSDILLYSNNDTYEFDHIEDLLASDAMYKLEHILSPIIYEKCTNKGEPSVATDKNFLHVNIHNSDASLDKFEYKRITSDKSEVWLSELIINKIISKEILLTIFYDYWRVLGYNNFSDKENHISWIEDYYDHNDKSNLDEIINYFVESASWIMEKYPETKKYVSFDTVPCIYSGAIEALISDFLKNTNINPKNYTEPKKETILSWEDYFVAVANLVKMRSKDPKCKVGACIVKDNRILSTGYNGFPNGCKDDKYPWDKGNDDPLKNKYFYVVHAELNAILNANKDISGSTIYVTKFPCNECVKAIIQSGIKTIVCSDTDIKNNQEATREQNAIFDMLGDAGVKFRHYKKKNISINIEI